MSKPLNAAVGPVLFLLMGACAPSALAVEQDLYRFIGSPAIQALDIYQRYISPAKGASCPMDPSDSAYARQAIGRRGLFMGVLMTADRLHRCGHDVGHYPLVRTSRGLKYSDPVDSAPCESLH